ncbi:MAG: glycine cleavage system aminomethyltransferase GcvT [Candidatus Geothermarchaeales archaeon]
MKRTPFYELYKDHATLTEFAGFDLPLLYDSIQEEHMAVRKRVGLFDVTHMGRTFVRGSEAEAYLDYLTANDIKRLEDNKGQYTLFCNDKGGVVDDLIVYRLNSNTYLLVHNAANRATDLEWMRSHTDGFDVIIEDVSDHTCMVAVQGPLSEVALTSSLPEASGLGRFHSIETTYGESKTIVSRTGYTGEKGFEVILWHADDPDSPASLWRDLLDSITEQGGRACGLGARDSLRLEAGFCLYGNDLTQEITPLEADLAWVVKFDQGDFIGKTALESRRGRMQRLRRGIILEKGIPRQGHKVLSASGLQIGSVSSGTFSPLLKRGIGFAYVETGYARTEEAVYIHIRGRRATAWISDFPFYDTEVYGATRKKPPRMKSRKKLDPRTVTRGR